MFDLLIRNAKIIDGTGAPWFRGDVAVSAGKIARVAQRIECECEAKEIIDAAGFAVAPGFIDVHSHDDVVSFVDPVNRPKLEQGVTTVINGNCGLSAFPVTSSTSGLLGGYLASLGVGVDFTWSSYAEFARVVSQKGLGANAGFLAPHGAIRIAVMGMENREPTRDELDEMKRLTAQCMEEGAYGLSSGLIYPPGMFSKPEEIIELCKVVARYGGLYACHMRDEGTREKESIEEVIRVGREAGLPVHIAHHKVTGKSNWGLSAKTLASIRSAREEGVDITLDAYPYPAGSTQLAALLPPWVHAGGEQQMVARLIDKSTRAQIREYIENRRDWQNFIAEMESWDSVLVTAALNHPEFIGKTLGAIGLETGKEPLEALFDLLSEVGYGAMMVVFMACEQDVAAIISDPYVMIASDAVPDVGVGLPHPRGRGTFPKVLRFARETGRMTIEEAVRKMTSMPACRFGLAEKGLIKEGMHADITVFDIARVAETNSYLEPRLKPVGIKHVVINGRIVVCDGVATGTCAGRLLLKK